MMGMPTVELHCGDCLDVMAGMEPDSVDSIVTDPPYGLKFMGRSWDHGVPGVPFWSAMLRVLKPGGYLLAFGGTRTFHRQVCAIEDSGFHIRDCLMWLHGQGFPKAKSCLKPSWEPITLAWSPAKNVPPLNVDACRIGVSRDVPGGRTSNTRSKYGDYASGSDRDEAEAHRTDIGRWPANLILGCCGLDPHAEDCPAAILDAQSGERRSSGHINVSAWESSAARAMTFCSGKGIVKPGINTHSDSGGASRFYFCSKASRADRGEGNTHVTVKPADLMRWLCRLITHPGGTILDPFMGSGSTLKAAATEGFSAIGIDQDPGSFATARRRSDEALAARASEFQFTAE